MKCFKHITFIFRPFLSFNILSVLASPDATDALLKKVGSEYLFKQDPEPPGSNLKGKDKTHLVDKE